MPFLVFFRTFSLVILIRLPVEIAVKQAMVKELNCSPTPENLKRLKDTIFDCNNPLDAYATQRMAELFYLILKNGRDRAESFLVKDPTDWESDPVYNEMQQKVRQMKVLSDCALIKSYNSCITKDKDQKQYLLQLVDLHRKKFPEVSKASLMK